MNRVQIQKMVDRAAKLDWQAKEIDKELKMLKSELKIVAEKTGERVLIGKIAEAKFSPTSKTTVSVSDFSLKASELGASDDVIMGALSVRIKDAKDVLGKTHFDAIAETETLPFGRITLKAI